VRFAALLSVVLIACGRESQEKQASSDTRALTDTGFGPISVGMTLAEANSALGETLRTLQPVVGTGCEYAFGRDSVAVMMEEGRIVRIEVRAPGVATSEGAKVGDTEARVQQLYADRITTTPHKYTSGHYLFVTPRDGPRGQTQLVFETDGSVVTEFRGGLLPAVAYVERCG
jgi:hypothetical protein